MSRLRSDMSTTSAKSSRAQPKTKPAQPAPVRRQLSPFDIAIWSGLILSILIVYARMRHYDFVNFDDDLYVYDNPHVQSGFTLASMKWALTAVVSSNWMPVTLFSHMLDAQLFGLRSGPQHMVNVIFHALSAIVLFMALQRATRMRWPSAFVAFAFALHPLHVGSVAWIAERKDVLSALFWFLALYAYVRYSEKPGRSRYLLVAALFSLGLMSKPMLVTFPFALLLFDLWPLRRFRWPQVLWEKLPLLALSAIVSVLSYFVQQSSGAFTAVPLGMRVGNALISYVTYIAQVFWPARLAVFYPYPRSLEAWQVAGAFALLLGVSFIVLRAWRARPYLTTGWFWYLGTLVPVIGLVQVGNQSRADRYTYIPMVGLTLMVAWGAAEAAEKWPKTKIVISIAAAVLCAIWMVDSSTQTAYWQNSETLYRHAIDVTADNWLAEYNLGHYLMDQPQRIADAIPHFEAVLRIKPNYPEANNNLGACLMNIGRNADAVGHFEAALRAKPDFIDAHYNLGLAFTRIPGRDADAETQFKAALRLAPDRKQAHNSLALLLVQHGRAQEAIPHLETVLRLYPDFRAEHNLGAVLAGITGRKAEALRHLEASQRLHPDPRNSQTIEALRAAAR